MGPHTLSSAMPGKANWASQLRKIQSCSTLILHILYQAGAAVGSRHINDNPHPHVHTHTHTQWSYDFRNLLRTRMLECWWDLHVDKSSVKWAYYLSCKVTVKNLIAQTVLVGTGSYLLLFLAWTRVSSPTATAGTRKTAFKTGSCSANGASQSAFHRHFYFWSCLPSVDIWEIQILPRQGSKETFDSLSPSFTDHA